MSHEDEIDIDEEFDELVAEAVDRLGGGLYDKDEMHDGMSPIQVVVEDMREEGLVYTTDLAHHLEAHLRRIAR